ncbi:MAG: hypothetical protein JWQ14_1285 [Adhaeribacter sp.]|jgi:uncharacterized membrane protein|nr:hypothetical protein [Adhaeribacter sp.]
MKTKTKTYIRVLGMGTVAGMRAMMAPALLSHFLVKSPAGGLNFSRLHYLQVPNVALGLKVAAGAELVGDKLPNIPNRTTAPQLLARVISGAVVGATLALANGQNKTGGALLGGLAAAASTHLFFFLRKEIGQAAGLPDINVAVVEDMVALVSGYQLAKG